MARLALLAVALGFLASPIEPLQITQQVKRVLTLQEVLKRNMHIEQIVAELRRLDDLECEQVFNKAS